jgi:hypothetical protein
MEPRERLGVTGASSFDAQSFFNQQQQQQQQRQSDGVEAGHGAADVARRAALLHATQGLLSASSSDSGSDSEARGAGGDRGRSRSPGAPGIKRARRRSGSSDGGGKRTRGERGRDGKDARRGSRERSDKGKRNKRAKEKKERRRRARSRSGSPVRRGGRASGRSDFDKIAAIERSLPPSAAAWGAGAGLSAALLGGAGARPAPGRVEAFLDTTGDPHNVTYQSLYARDVPRYTRIDPLNLVGDPRLRYAWQREAAAAAAEAARGESRLQRYFRGAAAVAERSRKAKRVRISELRAAGGSGGAGPGFPRDVSYIPFGVHGGGSGELGGAAGGGGGGQGGAPAAAAALAEAAGETAEEFVLRRTRDWNAAVRARPHDECLWLGFAAFQDAAARLLGRR